MRRIALPLAKFWVCKRTPFMVAEALECLGGNGYVEESGLPLLFRESPLNSIWEGSGNVNALDVLRALTREPEVLEAWINEVGAARGVDHRLDRAVDDTLALLGDLAGLEVGARRLAGQMAACLQGSLLVRFAPAEVADAFCASRLGTSYNGTFGTLDRRRPAQHRRPHHPGRADGDPRVGRDGVRRPASPPCRVGTAGAGPHAADRRRAGPRRRLRHRARRGGAARPVARGPARRHRRVRADDRQLHANGWATDVELHVADLTAPLPLDQPVDAVMSVAAFHWIDDHDLLFANLARSCDRGPPDVRLRRPGSARDPGAALEEVTGGASTA